MLATETCPICGSARTGSFRFCRSCGLDYDPADGSAPRAAATVAPPVSLDSRLDAAPDADAALGSGAAASATAAMAASETEAPGPTPRPASDVIVIQKRHLRLWAGALTGGLIGAMIAGALVVPLFDASIAAVGAIAGVVTIVAGALIGLRVAATKA